MDRDASASPTGARHRVRLRFRKAGDLRLIGHRDLATALERMFRRVDATPSMSGGFHPRPRMSFPLSLALGIVGLDELFEVDFDERPDADRLLADLNAAAPPGLTFTAVSVRPPGARKAVVAAASYQIEIPPPAAAGLAERVAALLAEKSHVVTRAHRDRRVDVRAAIESLTFVDGVLGMRLATDSAAAAAKPQEVLAALHLDHLLESGRYLTRTALHLATE